MLVAPDFTRLSAKKGPGSPQRNSDRIPSDILDDLSSRFIINVPKESKTDMVRMCFPIEAAHWFYKDFYLEELNLPPCTMKQFATQVFEHVLFLRPHLSSIDKILEDWIEYKYAIPTYGAIIISEDQKHVLLVQSYSRTISWAFPKGKVNEEEDPVHCAAREVSEEIGYDISDRLVPSDYMEAVINEQLIRLYLVHNVPFETVFKPRTRREIKCCKWFPLEFLPINKRDQISKINLDISPNSFYMIMPFIKLLKETAQYNHTINSFDKLHQSPNGFALNRKKSLTRRTNLSRRRSMSDADGNKINLQTFNNNNMNPSDMICEAAAKPPVTITSSSNIGISCSKSSTSLEQMQEMWQDHNISIENSSNDYFDEEDNSNNSSETVSTVSEINLKENIMVGIVKSSNIVDNNDIIKNHPVINERLRTTSVSNTIIGQDENQQQNMNMIKKPSDSKWNKCISWFKYRFLHNSATRNTMF